MTPYDFFQTSYNLFYAFFSVYLPSLPNRDPIFPIRSPVPCYPPPLLCLSHSPKNNHLFAVTLGYVLASEDVELRVSDEIKCVAFVYLALGHLTLFSISMHLPHEFYGFIAFHFKN